MLSFLVKFSTQQKEQKHQATVQQTADRFDTRANYFLLNDSIVDNSFQ